MYLSLPASGTVGADLSLTLFVLLLLVQELAWQRGGAVTNAGVRAGTGLCGLLFACCWP